MAATNYELHMVNCNESDELFKTLVLENFMPLLPVRIKNCSTEPGERMTYQEIFRLYYESVVENALKNLGNPVVPVALNKTEEIYLNFPKSGVIVAGVGWLQKIVKKLESRNMYPTHVQILIVCPDVTLEEIQKLPDSKLLHKFYFLVEDKDSVKLITFNWFTKESCRKKQLVIVNEHQNQSGWKHRNFESRKFFDFNGCNLGVGVTRDHPASAYNNYYDSEGNVIKNLFWYHGYYITMIQDVASNLNYKFTYNPSIASPFVDYGFYVFKNISVDFTIASCGTERYLEYPNDLAMTNAHAFVENLLLIPPGELYKDLEKFLLPFDLETWICIIVVVCVAIAVIIVIGFFSDGVKAVVYGNGVRHPMHNFFAHFFGVGQNVLPSTDFARITLMTYILFSLIIRTAYQSKQFEFLQQEMHKPEVKTIDELIQKNFTIHVVQDYFFLIAKLDIFQRAHYVNDTFGHMYNQLAQLEIFDPSFRGAIQVSGRHWRGLLDVTKGRIASRLLKDFRFNVEALGLCLTANNKLFDMWKVTTDRLMMAGIMQRWVDHEYQLDSKKHAHLSFKEPRNLSMVDLEVGFLICMICLGFSFLVFCCEVTPVLIAHFKRYVAARKVENQVHSLK